jgi:UDP-N-acetylglucosamine/UDP-N-acetylgalactosamine 4-epimerase
MKVHDRITNKKILVTGGAGFIGSNLCEYLLSSGACVICLDNLSTGHKKNISSFLSNKNFKFIEGDIRNIDTCQLACNGVDFVLHQAALGSVPRSIEDPAMTNDVNISGFLNMLIASKDNNIKRFIYAASSSTYGDSKELPKIENKIGNPLSPYAITKYVNELYATNFKTLYGLDSIGLRYFNVFGRRQDPNGPYSAVIPKFVKLLISHKSPTIYGDGSYSRDFTYIDNVILMNVLALTTTNELALNNIYNTAVGDRTTLLELVNYLKKYLAKYDDKISKIELVFGPNRNGDIPHSLASIQKAKKLLNYKPIFDIETGIENSVDWYYKNL